MRKLLFLDVDGVLNDLTVLSTREELGSHHLKNLKMIVAASRCEIVLSSSWRILDRWKEKLKVALTEHEIPLWIDQTPRLSLAPRREEIILWIKENVNCAASVVVLDDESDANIKNHQLDSVSDKFIHTCMNHGLTSEKAQIAIDFFKLT